MKVCSICSENKPLTDFYKQNKQRSDGEKYIYYHPSCKECEIKKAKQWQEDNEDRYREKMHKRAKRRWERPENKEYQRKWSKKQRDSGYLKEWQEHNKDKLAEYREQRIMNKTHDISDCEWTYCKEYFNYKCAYCGISEDISFELYSQQFHKEHVDYNGSNDISNCVPSCKSCNSKKWKYEFREWYNEGNEIYDEKRFYKILKWLDGDCIDEINHS